MRSETARSFFGVHKVVESADGRFRVLYHGTTIHGAQRIRDEAGAPVTGRPEPLTYYHDRGPMAEAVGAVRARKGKLDRVLVVGLGSGSLACQAKPGEQWTHFEIDPVVIRIAQDSSKFRFLHECAPGAPIVLGDARLTIADVKVPADVIVLDAFSSDVVPVHLLTREALDLYMSKLAPGGALVFHISNRYLELPSVVATIAAERGLVTLVKRDQSVTIEDFRAHDEGAFACRGGRARRERCCRTCRDGWDEAKASIHRCAHGPTISPTCSPPCVRMAGAK